MAIERTLAERKAILAAAKQRVARINEQQRQQREQPEPQPTTATTWGSKKKADAHTALEDQLERFVGGDRHALDSLPLDDRPSLPVVHNQAELQILEDRERRRPTMDANTQSLWEDFVDARCKSIVHDAVGMVADVIGDEMGLNEKKIRSDIQFMLNDTRAALRREYSDWIAAKNKEFTIEANKLRKHFEDEFQKMCTELGIDGRGGNVVDLPNPLRKA